MAGRDDEGTEGVLRSRPRHHEPTPCGPVERGGRHPVAAPPPEESSEQPYVDRRFRVAGRDGQVVRPFGDPSPGTRAREPRWREQRSPLDDPMTRYRLRKPEQPDPRYRVAPRPTPDVEERAEQPIRRVIDADREFRPHPSRPLVDRSEQRESRGPIRRTRWGRRIIRDDLDDEGTVEDGRPGRNEGGGVRPEAVAQLWIGNDPTVRQPPNAKLHTYRSGDNPWFRLVVTGENRPGLTFYLWVFRDDDWSQVVVDPPPTYYVPAGSEPWTDLWVDAPDDRLGLYRVIVSEEETPSDPTTRDGPDEQVPERVIEMRSAGTRPANHFTYAIVPDPESRPQAAPPVDRTFFGLAGVHPEQPLLPWLGARWVEQHRYRWERHPNPDWWDGKWGSATLNPTGTTDPNAPNACYWWMDPDRSPGIQLWDASGLVPAGSQWGVHIFPALFVTNGEGPPDWMNEFWKLPGPMHKGSYGLSGRGGRPNATGFEAWAGYAYQAAKKFSVENPGMSQRPYQITWEPDAFYGYRGVALSEPGQAVEYASFDDYGDILSAKDATLSGLGQVYGVGYREVRFGEEAGVGNSRAVIMGPTWPSLRRAGGGGELSWDPGPPPDPEHPWRWYTEPVAGVGYRNSPYFTQRDVLVEPVLDRGGNQLEDRRAPGLPLRVVDVLDAFSIHPYVRSSHLPHRSFGVYLDGDSLDPSFDQELIDGVRDLRDHLTELRAERGRGPLPMYATEYGFMTNNLSELNEEAARDRWNLDRTQALALVRESLILLGEGFRMGLAFQARDYAKGTESGVQVMQFGLYYNLEDGIYENAEGWKTGALAPRLAVPAYAALTSALEGFWPVPAWNATLESRFGPAGAWVYAFRRGLDVALAAWRPAGSASIESLVTPLSQLGVQFTAKTMLADWMGNEVPMAVGEPVSVGPEPVYVTGLGLQSPGIRPASPLSGARFAAFPDAMSEYGDSGFEPGGPLAKRPWEPWRRSR